MSEGDPKKDVSTKTVVILMVLVLVLSGLGAWSVADAIYEMNKIKNAKPAAIGQVKLGILKESDVDVGRVQLVILDEEAEKASSGEI